MKPTFQIIIFIGAALAVALLADAWHSARHDSQQLAATVAAQNSAIQQAADRQTQRDAQLAAALAAIQTQKRAVQTPHQAATQLAAVLPPLPLPVSVREPDLSVPIAPDSDEIPSTTISIPQPDLVPFYDAMQDCRANEIESETLQKDLSDEKTRSAAIQRERDAVVAAAHGGTYLMRLKRSAKWFAIGVAAGAVVAVAAHH